MQYVNVNKKRNTAVVFETAEVKISQGNKDHFTLETKMRQERGENKMQNWCVLRKQKTGHH